MSGGQVASVSKPEIIYGEFVEGTALMFMAYLTKLNGAALTSGDCSGSQSTLTVFRSSGATPTTAVYSSPVIGAANSLVAALSTSGWSRGGAGYNFTYTLPASAFTTYGGLTYRYEFSLPLLAGGSAIVIFEMLCKGVI